MIAASAGALATAAGRPLVLNAGPRDRREVAVLPAAAAPPHGQLLSGGGVAVLVEAPGSGAGPVPARPAPVVPVTATPAPDGGAVLANDRLRVRLDGDGLLASVRDLPADREVLAPGVRGNLLQLHPDRPAQWDAWDVERHYLRRWTDLTAGGSVEILDAGPLVAAVRVRRVFGDSTIVQTLTLRAGSARLDVACEVDWQERNAILKAAFPLDVHAGATSAEIQFGHVQRPTHTNTSWDAARFELYAHRWVHVGEPGYGVGVLTDSTYGYDAGRGTRDDGGTTTTVRLSLLRAPHSPDPEADRGLHRFGYALLPGADVDATISEAYALNLPLRTVPPPPVPGGAVPGGAVPGGAVPDVTTSLVSITDAGGGPSSAVIEAVKLADDGSGDVVVRLYESLGGRADARVRAGFDVVTATVTDLLERPFPDGARRVDDGMVDLDLRPFQIVTLRLARR